MIKFVVDYPNKFIKKTIAPKYLKEDQRLSKRFKSSKNQSSVVSEDRLRVEERLQKFLARAGVASRRHAEQMILDGRVYVNGIKIETMGTKVGPGDRIEIDGKPILQHEVFHYYLLNKPTGVITSTSDPSGRKTVLDILQSLPVRVYPVGRLDYDTSGLLLLTNNGELAHRLMHPSFGVTKTYRIWLKGPVDSKTMTILRQGVLLEDGKTAPAEVHKAKISTGSDLEVLEITIHEGRNRQIRRMCNAVGFPLYKLERIRFGPLKDSKLKYGQFRTLSQSEIHDLHSQVGLTPKMEVTPKIGKLEAKTKVRSQKLESRGQNRGQKPEV
ncbi:MAG: pseudouridine synthase [Desulfitobacteriaceae bacterium]